jgi:hypothetical protein
LNPNAFSVIVGNAAPLKTSHDPVVNASEDARTPIQPTSRSRRRAARGTAC